MKLITRDADYAVRALCEMARNSSRQFSVPELVSQLGIPKPFLRKILQTLNRKGLLESFPGQGGGFRLARGPGKIALLDVIRIFSENFSLNRCLFKRRPCPRQKTCRLRQEMLAVETIVLRRFKRLTIQSLSGRRAV